MNSLVKMLLAFEAFLFAAASLVHAGLLFGGYEHWRAATAEGVIAAVLVFGLFARLIRPASARVTALAVQVFALLGTLIGAFTIAIGIGPQTTVDHAFHLFLLAVLASGLVGWRFIAKDTKSLLPHGGRMAGTSAARLGSFIEGGE
ncbi:hypothetical protein EV132_112155 [Rhizobium sullae]|uniref:Uncharacterized protein n=2 Tax=Rhizobium sullae TaxID=50338 RepID=A0A4R3PZU4_RHISU|nr:hypothetical protein EV132_112155 [Rhizobium sullae]